MNAINFIKQHGVEKARGVLKAIPENQHWFSDVMMNETGRWVVMQAPALIHETGEKYISTFRLCKEWQPKFTKLKDLKRLIESVDLIKKHGGLFSTKCQLDKGGSDYEWYEENGDYGLTDLGDLEQAIADYEAIYSIPESVRQVILNLEMHP